MVQWWERTRTQTPSFPESDNFQRSLPINIETMTTYQAESLAGFATQDSAEGLGPKAFLFARFFMVTLNGTHFPNQNIPGQLPSPAAIYGREDLGASFFQAESQGTSPKRRANEKEATGRVCWKESARLGSLGTPRAEKSNQCSEKRPSNLSFTARGSRKHMSSAIRVHYPHGRVYVFVCGLLG